MLRHMRPRYVGRSRAETLPADEPARSLRSPLPPPLEGTLPTSVKAAPDTLET